MPERYFFQLSNHLLELDALEMDEVLRHALREVPNEGLVQFHVLRHVMKPAVQSKPERERRKPKVEPKTAEPVSLLQQTESFAAPILCTVDHDAGLVHGERLGDAFSGAYASPIWIIERARLTTSTLTMPVFFIYPPDWLLNGHKSHNLESEPQVRQNNSDRSRIRFHMDEAKEFVEGLAHMPVVPTREVDLHRQAVHLSLKSGFDEVLSLKILSEITPFPHQIRTVERVLRRMRGRALLCDEVGLGKTIEAGIVLTEYMLRGLVRRVLILTPPSLVEQWKEEVTRKLGLSFVCYDEPRFKAANRPWQTFEHVIASLDTAKREPHRDEILETQYDLVIVDEAHHLKNKSTLAWKFVNQLKKKYILLLTATPIENDMSELFNLITLLKPGQLLTEAEYKRRYVDKKDPLQPKNVAELQRLIQNVMIRNRRSTTGVIQSTRIAETILVPPSREEREFYRQLSQFVKFQLQTLAEVAVGQAGTKTTRAQKQPQSVHPFVLKNLLRQAGSSIACVLPTLHRFRSTGEGALDAGLQEIVNRGKDIYHSGKLDALLRIVENTPHQVVVFTGFVETAHVVTKFLTRAGLSVVDFHGSMSRAQKEQSIAGFREGAKVLVSTESGGEGRNLQFCHTMVNFDIPWNPMRIEQRIGRIHRIGQQHEVSIYNLAAKGTLEEHILHILDAKVNLFQLVIGELDMILGSLDEKREFEDILMDIWVKASDEAELIRGVEELGDELLAAKTHYQKVRDVDDRLLSELIGDE